MNGNCTSPARGLNGNPCREKLADLTWSPSSQSSAMTPELYMNVKSAPDMPDPAVHAALHGK